MQEGKRLISHEKSGKIMVGEEGKTGLNWFLVIFNSLNKPFYLD